MRKTLLAALLTGAVMASAVMAIPAAAKDYKLGSVHSLTGPYAFVGVPITNGLKLAAEEINASGLLGDGNKINLVIEDAASDRAQVTSLMTRFGNDAETLLVFGPSSTIEALASAPAANAAKLPTMTNGALPQLLELSSYLFRMLVPTAVSQETLAKFALSKGVKQCAFVTVSDNEGYLSQRNALKENLTRANVAIVADETPKSNETDFSALSTKIVALKPDCIFLNAPAEYMANVITQLRNAGLDSSAHVFIDTGGGSPNFLSAGGKAVEGVSVLTLFAAPGSTPLAHEFTANFQKRYGNPPDSWAAIGFSAMHVVANALKAAGPDVTRDKLRAAMMQTKDQPTVLGAGKISIGEDRETRYDLTVLTVKDGKWVAP